MAKRKQRHFKWSKSSADSMKVVTVVTITSSAWEDTAPPGSFLLNTAVKFTKLRDPAQIQKNVLHALVLKQLHLSILGEAEFWS